MATTARALGASRSIQSVVLIGWPVWRRCPSPPSSRLCRMDLLVGDRAFHHQHEGIELAFLGLIERLDELVANFVRQNGIMEVHFGEARNGAQQNIFDAGLRGCGDGNRIAITAQTGGYPDDVNFGDGGCFLR